MINNQGSFAKLRTSAQIDGTTGIKGQASYDVFSEVKLVVEVFGVGASNILAVEGKIDAASTWGVVGTITGPGTATLDISTVDNIRFNVTTSDGVGNFISSGFITSVSTSGGGGGSADSTAANQVTQINLATSTNTKLDTLNAKDFATSAKQDTGNASLSSIDTKLSGQFTNTQAQAIVDQSTGASGATVPARVQMAGFVDVDGNASYSKLTETGVLGVGNGMKKFRDGFADLAQGAAPDSTIWDVAWTNQGSSTIGRAGNAQGSSYMKISMCPYTVNSEVTMTTKRTFKYPMRFINMLSISQRILGQEFEISLVGVDGSGAITTIGPIADLTISGTVTITSNIATINFATPHGLKTSDRVILVGNTERRLNVGPTPVTVVTATQITVPCSLANGTYTAGGVVRWADPLAYAKNGAGLLYENATATNATFLTRRNGFNTRLLNSTVATTANASAVNYCDPFNGAAYNAFVLNQEDFSVVSRAPDTASPSSVTPLKWHQGLPDEELEYKIRIRAKNLSNLTVPVAKIVSISKAGSTAATVTTDVPHGLTTSDFIQIYGVRDITNFPNLTSQTAVASIVSPTQFVVTMAGVATTTSAGGAVYVVQGSAAVSGISAVNIQSIQRTNNVISLVGNTTWTSFLPGETVHIYGCDATSMGLYDGAYKVLKINTTTLELESIGANFGLINCGGAVMRRTDFRVHAVSQIEHTRLIAELSNGVGATDLSKAMPVIFGTAQSVIQATGATISSSTGLGGWYMHPAMVRLTDVASAAITATSIGAAISNTLGSGFQFLVDCTAISGTTPTMDVEIQESFDGGVTFTPLYTFPRITAVIKLYSPVLKTRGSHFRIVRTVAGTTPSFTNSITRLILPFHQTNYIVQVLDRTIVPNTLNSVTPWFFVENINDFNIYALCSAQTTAATLTLEFSDDQTNVHTTANTITTAVGTVHIKVTNEQWKWARLKVTTAGTGITLTHVSIKGKEG